MPNGNGERQKLAVREVPCNKCTVCAWEGPCDLHRIKMGKDGGKYTVSNVISLCPNCHRLFHLGLLETVGAMPVKHRPL